MRVREGISRRPRFLERARQAVYDHFVLPFRQSHDPPGEVAWGASIGVFVGLTPTVGVQIYSMTVLWLLLRYVVRFRFNLTIAMATVWVTNPVTTLPLYFLFFETGDLLQTLVGQDPLGMTFATFKAELARAGADYEGWVRWLLVAGQYVIVEFGWPLVLGSMVYAVPSAVLAYPVTYVLLRRYRRYLAASEGLSYGEWRRRYETRP